MNYDHNKKFGLFKLHSGYGKFYLNSPNGYNRKIINAHTELVSSDFHNSNLFSEHLGTHCTLEL